MPTNWEGRGFISNKKRLAGRGPVNLLVRQMRDLARRGKMKCAPDNTAPSGLLVFGVQGKQHTLSLCVLLGNMWPFMQGSSDWVSTTTKCTAPRPVMGVNTMNRGPNCHSWGKVGQIWRVCIYEYETEPTLQWWHP